MLKAVNRPSHALELIDAIHLLECLTILKVRLMKSWERYMRLIKIVIFVIMKIMSSIITRFSFDCLDKMGIEFPLVRIFLTYYSCKNPFIFSYVQVLGGREAQVAALVHVLCNLRSPFF